MYTPILVDYALFMNVANYHDSFLYPPVPLSRVYLIEYPDILPSQVGLKYSNGHNERSGCGFKKKPNDLFSTLSHVHEWLISFPNTEIRAPNDVSDRDDSWH